MTAQIRGVALAALLLAATPDRANACSCMEVGPPCEAAWSVESVFAGTVGAITEVVDDELGAPYRNYLVRFDVDRPFRNAPAGSIDVLVSGGTCGYRFTNGRRYLVYASKHNGKLITSICSRTRPIDEAGEDLRYLNALPVAATGARVYGRIKQREWDPGAEVLVDYGPMEGLRVYVAGPAFGREVLTDENGRFEMTGVPHGAYRIGAIVPPEFDSRYLEREFEVKDVRTCIEANFDVRWEARISGTVLDEHGRPVQGVTVEAIAEEHAASPPRPYGRPEAKTDAAGAFELAGVAPARYVITIALKSRSSAPAQPVRVFFPGTRLVEEAAVVELSAGERRQLAPFRLELAQKQ